MKNHISKLLLLILAGCSGAPSPKSFTPIPIEGIMIPGKLEHAKEAGFIDCKATYYAYTCSRVEQKEIFGVKPVHVSISLNGSNNFQESSYASSTSGDVRSLSLEQLSYRQVDITFSSEIYDEKCLRKNKLDRASYPELCLQVPGAHAFMRALRQAGWVESSWKTYENFIRDGVAVEISVQPYKNQATISPQPLAIVQDRLRSIRARQEEMKQKETQANEVVKHMKDGK